eukprot:6687775-Pyramimonas_sp.AAC.1
MRCNGNCGARGLARRWRASKCMHLQNGHEEQHVGSVANICDASIACARAQPQTSAAAAASHPSGIAWRARPWHARSPAPL